MPTFAQKLLRGHAARAAHRPDTPVSPWRHLNEQVVVFRSFRFSCIRRARSSAARHNATVPSGSETFSAMLRSCRASRTCAKLTARPARSVKRSVCALLFCDARRALGCLHRVAAILRGKEPQRLQNYPPTPEAPTPQRSDTVLPALPASHRRDGPAPVFQICGIFAEFPSRSCVSDASSSRRLLPNAA